MMNKKVLTLDDEPIASIYYTMKECNKKSYKWGQEC